MQFAKNRIERLKVMGFKNVARYLARFLHFQSDFKTYEDFVKWHTDRRFTETSTDFFSSIGLQNNMNICCELHIAKTSNSNLVKS